MPSLTLKENYRAKKEQLFETIILEAFDKNLMMQASNIFKTLLSINFSGAGLKTFASARDNAVKNVDEIISNKSERGLIRKFINLFKSKQNPLLDSLAFCDALQNFFENFLQYVEAKKTGVTDADNRRLRDLIVGTGKQTPETAEKIENFERLIQKGLQPDGILKKMLGNSWQKKYLKNNYKAIAQELLSANVKKLEDIGNQVINNIKNVDEVAQSVVGATQSAAKQTTGTTGTEQTKSNAPTGSTTPTEKTNDSNVGSEKVSPEAKKAIETANAVYADISSDFAGLDAETVKKTIAILAHNNKIKL